MEDRIKIIAQSDGVDRDLEFFREALGATYDGYRNHLYRVLSYTLHTLKGDETYREAIEFALVYHDIGIYTHNTMRYLEPSVEVALAANAKRAEPFEAKLIHDLIYYHHKIFPVTGSFSEPVNAFRKGDWIDATSGKRRMGMSRRNIDAVRRALPDLGFIEQLSVRGKERSGSSLKLYSDLLRVLKI